MGRPPPLRLLLILAALLPPPGARRAREMGLEGGREGGVWGWGSPSRDEVGKGGDGAGLSAPLAFLPQPPAAPRALPPGRQPAGLAAAPCPGCAMERGSVPTGRTRCVVSDGGVFFGGGAWGAHPALGSPSGHGDASWSLLLGC